MTRRELLDLALMGISLAALVARAVAMALTDIDQGLQDFRVDGPHYIPCEWEAEVDEQ